MSYTPENNPYIPGDPYSYDLKWIVAKVKEALSSIEGLTTAQGDLSESFDELREYVNNYFDELDISAEVTAKIQELAEAGFFDPIIEGWLNDHIKWDNKNLLDNPWFTVNQRGQALYNSGNPFMTVDRWKMNNGAGVNYLQIISNGVQIKTSGNGLAQVLEDVSGIDGKVVTASLMMADGSVNAWTFTYDSAANQGNTFANGCRLAAGLSGGKQQFVILTLSLEYAEIRAVKLELGSYSTLANDTAPNYSEELAKCQQYFIRYFASAISALMFMQYSSATAAAGVLYLPQTMRAKPSLSYSGTLQMYRSGGWVAVSALSVEQIINNALYISATTTGGTTGNIDRLMLLQNAYIDLSADL